VWGKCGVVKANEQKRRIVKKIVKYKAGVIRMNEARIPKVANQVIKLAPQKGPQTDFLSSEADIAIYGGSAGGGKSYALLLEPLRYIEHGRFNCTIFRRTSPMIRNAGGLWDSNGFPFKF